MKRLPQHIGTILVLLTFTVAMTASHRLCAAQRSDNPATAPSKSKGTTKIGTASLLKAQRIRLAQEEKVVRVLRQELDLQIRELLKLKEDISGLVIQKNKILAEIKKLNQQNNPAQKEAKTSEMYKKLGEYYSSMRASKAASILQEMDPNDVVQILLSMDPDAAAGILQRMDPKKAAVVSERMRGGNGDSEQ